MSETFSHPPLVTSLRRRLLDGILSGEFESGTRLNESELADELGVSRTPLREALHRLVGARFLDSKARKGFFVPPLSRREAEDLYHAVGVLEAAVFEHDAVASDVQLERLGRISREREQVKDDPRRNIELDREWHSELLAGAENEFLLQELSDLKQRMLRYELAFQHSVERVEVALEGHREIEDALDGGRAERIPALLREHWEEGLMLVQDSDCFGEGTD